tara:strand:- start:453 stop:716 length:264 start_codon:yes stop_codon:yes gene_type:complete
MQGATALATVEMLLPTLMRPGSKVGPSARSGSFDSTASTCTSPAAAPLAMSELLALGEDSFSYSLSFPGAAQAAPLAGRSSVPADAP